MKRGINLTTVKAHNEALLLDLIRRHDPVSRRELSEIAGLTPATISSIVGRLITENVVIEGATVASRGGAKGGRHRTTLHLVPGARVAGGVIVDRLGLSGAIIDIGGNVYDHFSIRFDNCLGDISEDNIVLILQCAFIKLKHQIPEGSRFCGWGLGVPMWYPRGLLWEKVVARIQEQLQEPIEYTQNAVCSAIGEWWSADVSPQLPTLYLFLGGGIGGCFIQQEEHHAGPIFQSAEIGHMGISPEGPLCYCGGRGCLEQLAGPNLLATGTNVQQIAEYLGYALRSLTLLLDVKEIIIAGPRRNLLGLEYLVVLQRVLDGRSAKVRMTNVAPQDEAVGAAAAVFQNGKGWLGPQNRLRSELNHVESQTVR